MRAIALMVTMVAACRFAPNGGAPADDVVDAAIDDVATVDAIASDAQAIDARVIDARAIDAGRAACPATYDVSNNGGRYLFHPIAQWRVLAEADCDDDLLGQTHLATFEAAGDLDAAIAAVDPGNSATPWVGARCTGELDCSLRSAWTWVTGAAVEPLLWAQGQPDNGFTERVARAERLQGTWVLSNVIAGTTLPYICECDP